MATLEINDGKFLKADLKSAEASLSDVALPPGSRRVDAGPSGDGAYLFVTNTLLLCYRKYDDPKISKALKSVIDFGLTKGQSYSAELGYVPLPPNVVITVQKAADEIS